MDVLFTNKFLYFLEGVENNFYSSYEWAVDMIYKLRYIDDLI
jgi:hypothetical protein